MTEPTIAEESLARMLAFWHGQTPLFRDPITRVLVTVATSHKMSDERTGWSWETDRYVDKHWRDYVAAAQAVIRFRGEQ